MFDLLNIHMHMAESQRELQSMYAHMIHKRVIFDSMPEFGKFSHAMRVYLPCGMHVSVSRVQAMESGRTAPWEIAIVDPTIEENSGIITDQKALHPDDEHCVDPMVKIVGKDVFDLDALEMELRRINQYYIDKSTEGEQKTQ